MKKVFSLVLAGVIGLSVPGNTSASVLYKESKEQTITKGAQLIKENMLTHEGWRNVFILKIDLNESNVQLRPLESSTLGERKNILSLATSAGAVAGINTDYFDMGTSNTPSFGPVIQDGQIKHAYNNILGTLGPKKNMGTFLIDNQNNPLIDCFSTVIEIYANDTKIVDAASYNNIPNSLAAPIILDRQYYQDTTKVLPKFKNAYTVVVEHGIVTYISSADEVVSIPQDGYVILMNEASANAYTSFLSIGSSVEVRETIQLGDNLCDSISNMKLGIGGGGLIMKDGETYTGPAHRVTPNAKDPRTVVATTKNPNEILLIAIDGRNDSVGVTHTDLVELLKSYNVKDAMYFDGGGSTTLVARPTGEKEVKLQNVPSEGTQRKVANGIGVFTSNPTGALAKLYIETSADRVFAGESIKLTLKGTDENDNPVDVASNDVKWSVAGVAGSFKNGSFYPTAGGKALIVASLGSAEAVKEIVVSDKPIGLRIEPAKIQINENSSKEVKVLGIDKEGYAIPLSADKITWKSSNQSVKASGNKVSVSKKTVATLTATYKGINAKASVIAGAAVVPVESFEKNIATWAGSSVAVKGKVEPSKDIKYHGEKSLKLTYTFGKSTKSQAAYAVLKSPIAIGDDTCSVNMWLYAKEQGDTVKVELVDKGGKKHYLTMTDSLDHQGWKYFSASLTSAVKLPAKITKIYVNAESVAEERTSPLYIDHISVTRGPIDSLAVGAKADYLFDPMYKESLQAATGTDYFIHVVGPTISSDTAMKEKTATQIANTLSKGTSMVVMASQKNTSLPLSVNAYTYKNVFESVDHNNTQILFVPTNSGGIRESDKEAWIKVKNALESKDAKNIILIMSKDPLTEFKDSKEGKAFHKYLVSKKEAEGKNIFVVSTGGTEEVTIQDGIRYIKTSGIATATQNIKDARFIKFKVVGNNIYYSFGQLVGSN